MDESQGSSSSSSGGQLSSSAMDTLNVKKCRDFLTTLTTLTHKFRQPETAKNVEMLVQNLINANMKPEQFVLKLQKELILPPQPYLVPFLERRLPHLRQSWKGRLQASASTVATADGKPVEPTCSFTEKTPSAPAVAAAAASVGWDGKSGKQSPQASQKYSSSKNSKASNCSPGHSPSPQTKSAVSKSSKASSQNANMKPEQFVLKLQKELILPPQPYLVPFLERRLPHLRQSWKGRLQASASTVATADGKPVEPTCSFTEKTPSAPAVAAAAASVGWDGKSGKQSPQASQKYSSSKNSKASNCSPGHSPSPQTKSAVSKSSKASSQNANMKPEQFVLKLQKELILPPQPYLVPFLERRLPHLRQSWKGRLQASASTVATADGKPVEPTCSFTEKTPSAPAVAAAAASVGWDGKSGKQSPQASQKYSSSKNSKASNCSPGHSPSPQTKSAVSKSSKASSQTCSKQEDPKQLKLKQKAEEWQQMELKQLKEQEANLTTSAPIRPIKKRKVDSPTSSSSQFHVILRRNAQLHEKLQPKDRLFVQYGLHQLQGKMVVHLRQKVEEKEEKLTKMKNEIEEWKKQIKVLLEKNARLEEEVQHKDKILVQQQGLHQKEVKMLKMKMARNTEECEEERNMMEEQIAERDKKIMTLQRKMKETVTNMFREFECPICKETLIKAYGLPSCGHTFCNFCITEWKKRNEVCPLCKSEAGSPIECLVLDRFIDNLIDHLGNEAKQERNKALKDRGESIQSEESQGESTTSEWGSMTLEEESMTLEEEEEERVPEHTGGVRESEAPFVRAWESLSESSSEENLSEAVDGERLRREQEEAGIAFFLATLQSSLPLSR